MSDFAHSGPYGHSEHDYREKRVRLPRLARLLLIMLGVIGTVLAALMLFSPSPQTPGKDPQELSGEQKLYGNLLRVVDHTDRIVHAVGDGLGGDVSLVGKLVTSEIGDPAWQRNFSASLIRIGRLRWEGGDQEGALRIFRQALVVRQRLHEAHPDSPEYLRHYVAGLYRVAYTLFHMHQTTEALELFEKADRMTVRLTEMQPEMRLWLQWRETLHKWMGRCHGQLGDRERAVLYFAWERHFRAKRYFPSNDGEPSLARHAYVHARQAEAGYQPRINYERARDSLLRLSEQQELSDRQRQWLETINSRLATME